MRASGRGWREASAVRGLVLAAALVVAGCTHRIQGYVQDPAGRGVPGVTMVFSGKGVTVTEADGFYSRKVPDGWRGTVTPEKPPLVFDPVLRRYERVRQEQTRQDFWVKDEASGTWPPVVTPPIIAPPVVTPPVVTPPASDTRPIIVTPARPYESPLTPAAKRELVDQSRIAVLNVGVVSDETLVLSGGVRPSDIALRTVRGWLANNDFRVQQGPADLVLLIRLRGTSREFDRFGNYYRFEAELDGKVEKPRGELITERRFTQRGSRSRNEVQAAEDALTAAATEAVTYLSDEIIRQCRRLHTTTLNLRNIEDLRHVLDVLQELRGRPGIAYASLERWTEKSQTALVEIVHSTLARDLLGTYLETLQRQKVEVELLTQDYVDAERD